MDFENHNTAEMELFRQEVRRWLEENVPEEMTPPVDPADATEEMFQFWRQKQRELGQIGWLYPTYPKEYGGGGLTPEHETILEEEFQRMRVPAHELGPAVRLVVPLLLVWGTEEQKQKFLRPLLTGERIAWEKLTEPHSGSDLASYKSKAVREGDEWVLNGSNAFQGGHETEPAWYYGPMLTDPNAPRHRNLGFFMIPYPHPGVEIRWMDLLHGQNKFNRKAFFFMDDVRLPADHLIGGDHQGWQVLNTTLEQEHGGRGRAFPEDEVVKNLLSYMREKRRASQAPGGDPVIVQAAVDAYLGAEIDELFKRRTYWMYMNRMDMTWEGPSSFHWQRVYSFRNVAKVRDVMGMYSLLSTKDTLAPHGGAQELNQRHGFIHQHGAGSFNITRVVLARRIGISRTRERAAATPMTAGHHGG